MILEKKYRRKKHQVLRTYNIEQKIEEPINQPSPFETSELYHKLLDNISKLEQDQDNLLSRMVEMERMMQTPTSSKFENTINTEEKVTRPPGKIVRPIPEVKTEPKTPTMKIDNVVDKNAIINKVISIVKEELEEYATNNSLEELKISFNKLQESIQGKYDNETLAKLEKATIDMTKLFESKIPDLEWLKSVQEKIINENAENIAKVREEINENKDAIKRTLDLIDSLKSTTEDFEKEIAQCATSIELTAIKNYMDEY